jgi:hypothetical protein
MGVLKGADQQGAIQGNIRHTCVYVKILKHTTEQHFKTSS